MADTLGYRIVEADKGRVVVTARPNATQLNPHGTVHGGLAATILDSCMGLAVMTLLDNGVGSTTLEFKVSFMQAITPETSLIRAEGTVVNQGRRHDDLPDPVLALRRLRGRRGDERRPFRHRVVPGGELRR
jgi:uncharacterized protein (TIGR00369 family)